MSGRAWASPRRRRPLPSRTDFGPHRNPGAPAAPRLRPDLGVARPRREMLPSELSSWHAAETAGQRLERGRQGSTGTLKPKLHVERLRRLVKTTEKTHNCRTTGSSGGLNPVSVARTRPAGSGNHVIQQVGRTSRLGALRRDYSEAGAFTGLSAGQVIARDLIGGTSM